MGGTGTITKPPAVVLAGGQARRMGGGDKGLLPLAGRPLLAHVLGRLIPQAGRLAINANGDPARFARFGRPVLADPLPGGLGPLAGVLAALDWAAGQGADHVVTVAADTPFLPVDLVARLVMAGDFALAAGDGGRLHPTCGRWPVILRAPLRAALLAGERRVGRWATGQGAVAIPFAGRPDPFFNINTPDDLVRAERLLIESTGA